MKAKSIQIGNTYHITLGRNEVLGEVIEAADKGWNVRLTASGKVIKVNNSDRFLRKARTIATTQDEAAVATPDAEIVETEAQRPKPPKRRRSKTSRPKSRKNTVASKAR
ncbi:hypothetical protein AGMMS50229_18930 [Campylobacterota bacterium]|nr:hypothetical protein AGMMS50229_18930 [Campylobacterota bacterium]